MRRREFFVVVSGAAAWPLAARAQQQPLRPTAGFLVSASAAGYQRFTEPVLNGLREAGYVDGKNLTIEYRWADYQYDRLPALAADLVGRQVAVIFCTGSVVSALAAKSATKTIPIIFANGSDPVKYGLVESLNRPGGNMTGVTFYNSGLGPKRIELLRQLVPNAAAIGLLLNPNNPNAADDGKEIEEAGKKVGIRIEIINASSNREIDEAFAGIGQRPAQSLGAELRPISVLNAEEIERAVTAFAGEPNGGLIVTPSAAESTHRELIINLAARHRLPAIYAFRFWVIAGGLASYGPDPIDQMRLAADYVDRILKGAKPSDLPVQTPTRYQFVINLKTAKALDLKIAPALLSRADEVIE